MSERIEITDVDTPYWVKDQKDNDTLKVAIIVKTKDAKSVVLIMSQPTAEKMGHLFGH